MLRPRYRDRGPQCRDAPTSISRSRTSVSRWSDLDVEIADLSVEMLRPRYRDRGPRCRVASTSISRSPDLSVEMLRPRYRDRGPRCRDAWTSISRSRISVSRCSDLDIEIADLGVEIVRPRYRDRGPRCRDASTSISRSRTSVSRCSDLDIEIADLGVEMLDLDIEIADLGVEMLDLDLEVAAVRPRAEGRVRDDQRAGLVTVGEDARLDRRPDHWAGGGKGREQRLAVSVENEEVAGVWDAQFPRPARGVMAALGDESLRPAFDVEHFCADAAADDHRPENPSGADELFRRARRDEAVALEAESGEERLYLRREIVHVRRPRSAGRSLRDRDRDIAAERQRLIAFQQQERSGAGLLPAGQRKDARIVAKREAEGSGPGLEEPLPRFEIGALGHHQGDLRTGARDQIGDHRGRRSDVAGPEDAHHAVEALDVRREVVVAAGVGVEAPGIESADDEAREPAAAAGDQRQAPFANRAERAFDTALASRGANAIVERDHCERHRTGCGAEGDRRSEIASRCAVALDQPERSRRRE